MKTTRSNTPAVSSVGLGRSPDSGTSPVGRFENAGASAGSTTDRETTVRLRGRPIPRQHIILLANQMAVMLDTGVPLAEALRSILNRTRDARFYVLLEDVVSRVESGQPLSEALAAHGRAFPGVMIALVRASEASGTMSEMLNQISTYLIKEHQTIKQIRGAIMYPAFMLTMSMSITMFLLMFIMPRFVSIYEGRNATLPGLTRALMSVSAVVTDHWHVWMLAGALTVIGLMAWRRTRLGRVQLDWLKLHTPVLAAMFSEFYLSRVCRTMGTMLDTGVPLLDSITIVRGVANSPAYERLWEAMDRDLVNGRPVSTSLYDSPVIPDHIAQMVESGEGSGRLGTVFNRIADYSEANFEQTVKTSTQFIEPVMIMMMGGIIGFVAIALLLPVFSVGRVVAGG